MDIGDTKGESMDKCKWLGHKWSKWKRGFQPQIDTKTKVKTSKPIQERFCQRCNYVEREYI